MFRNHLRPEISVPTADLNELKRSEFPVRSSSIRSRKSESRSGPSATIESTTWATGASKASTGGLDVSERQLEVRDLLRLQPAPDLPFRRHRLGAIAATPDQVEQRRRELERPRRAALGEETRHERRLGLGRRLLLVLPVVARPVLPAAAPPDERDHGERGPEREQEQERERSWQVVERLVDLALVALVRRRVRPLLGDDLLEARPALHLHPRGRGEDAAWHERCAARRTGRPECRAPAGWRACRRSSRRRGRRRDGPRRARCRPGATSVAVSWPSLTSHSSPQTLTFTSTTSS